MEFEAIISGTGSAVKIIVYLAMYIRDSEKKNSALKETANIMIKDFTLVGSILDQLQTMAHKVTVNDEIFLMKNINSLRDILSDARKVLEDVKRDRTFFKRLIMNKESYRQQLVEIKQRLYELCDILQKSIPMINKVSIPSREFPDFRKLFQQLPEKSFWVYDYFIIRDKLNSSATINIDEFDRDSPCYMKLGQEQVIFSHQIRTWSTGIPKSTILSQRRAIFEKKYSSLADKNLSDIGTRHDSLPSLLSPLAIKTPSVPLPANETNERLDFTEFFMSHDDVCGIAMTQTFLFIATKHEITIVSLIDQKIIAQYGTKGDGNNTFKQISCLYIPFDNENNLYIVDRGQSAVHLYKINDQGNRFEFVRRYIIIADVIERPNLVACVIFNNKLFISDDANNCLHIFNLQADRQLLYLRDNTMTPFSPGSLCVYKKYLYVANCSLGSPSIVIFDEQCNPVDWFRNKLFESEQILAIDLCPNLNELFILTTTNDSNKPGKKRPLIVTTDPCIRSI